MTTASPKSVTLLAAVALAAATACTSSYHPSAPVRTSGLRCDKGYAVLVHNNTPEEVDIWQSTPEGEVYVGAVSGRTASDLPLMSGGAVKWRWPPENPPRFHPSWDVTLRVHCT